MVQRQTEPDRSAVVEDINREFLQTDHLGELSDNLRQMVKRVGKAFVVRRVGKAEAGQITQALATAMAAGPASSGIRLRNMWLEVGKPCSKRTAAAWGSPASR